MNDELEVMMDDGENSLIKVESKVLSRIKIQKNYRQQILENYIDFGFPKKAYRRNRNKKGNVVLAYTSSCFLMLDCDQKTEQEVKQFAKEYSLEQDLGSSAVWRTSESSQTDLFGNLLGNYCVIFGKLLSWDEIKWHVQEAYRLGMVNQGFVIIRKFGSITIRVNSKNEKIPPPMPISYYSNGGKKARQGVIAFINHWIMCREMG